MKGAGFEQTTSGSSRKQNKQKQKHTFNTRTTPMDQLGTIYMDVERLSVLNYQYHKFAYVFLLRTKHGLKVFTCIEVDCFYVLTNISIHYS